MHVHGLRASGQAEEVIGVRSGNFLSFLGLSSLPDRSRGRDGDEGRSRRPNQGGPRNLCEQARLENSGTQ